MSLRLGHYFVDSRAELEQEAQPGLEPQSSDLQSSPLSTVPTQGRGVEEFMRPGSGPHGLILPSPGGGEGGVTVFTCSTAHMLSISNTKVSPPQEGFLAKELLLKLSPEGGLLGQPSTCSQRHLQEKEGPECPTSHGWVTAPDLRGSALLRSGTPL